MWPNWNWFLAGCNESVQWRSGVGSREAASWPAMLCRKGIFDSMNQKLLDCAEIGLAVHIRPMNEMSCLGSPECGVYLRGAHRQISSQLCKRGPIRTVPAKFENYD